MRARTQSPLNDDDTHCGPAADWSIYTAQSLAEVRVKEEEKKRSSRFSVINLLHFHCTRLWYAAEYNNNWTCNPTGPPSSSALVFTIVATDIVIWKRERKERKNKALWLAFGHRGGPPRNKYRRASSTAGCATTTCYFTTKDDGIKWIRNERTWHSTSNGKQKLLRGFKSLRLASPLLLFRSPRVLLLFGAETGRCCGLTDL